MQPLILTPEQIVRFQKDGYLLVEHFLTGEALELLVGVAKSDRQLAAEKKERQDAAGGVATIAVRNELPDTIYSAIVRSHRMVNTMEALLGDEVYHYHHKMNFKEPYVGGAWEWHQDYGYWYNNGCLYPDMASCMIAVDKATKENGCLQVLRSSHLMGRLDHGKTGDQTGADLERVEEALKRLELIYAEMEPGSAIFFHSNLLHRSDQNRSPNPRYVLICCYNTRHNDPYKVTHHPNYSYLERWPDERIVEVGRAQMAEVLASVPE